MKIKFYASAPELITDIFDQAFSFKHKGYRWAFPDEPQKRGPWADGDINFTVNLQKDRQTASIDISGINPNKATRGLASLVGFSQTFVAILISIDTEPDVAKQLVLNTLEGINNSAFFDPKTFGYSIIIVGGDSDSDPRLQPLKKTIQGEHNFTPNTQQKLQNTMSLTFENSFTTYTLTVKENNIYHCKQNSDDAESLVRDFIQGLIQRYQPSFPLIGQIQYDWKISSQFLKTASSPTPATETPSERPIAEPPEISTDNEDLPDTNAEDKHWLAQLLAQLFIASELGEKIQFNLLAIFYIGLIALTTQPLGVLFTICGAIGISILVLNKLFNELDNFWVKNLPAMVACCFLPLSLPFALALFTLFILTIAGNPIVVSTMAYFTSKSQTASEDLALKSRVLLGSSLLLLCAALALPFEMPLLWIVPASLATLTLLSFIYVTRQFVQSPAASGYEPAPGTPPQTSENASPDENTEFHPSLLTESAEQTITPEIQTALQKIIDKQGPELALCKAAAKYTPTEIQWVYDQAIANDDDFDVNSAPVLKPDHQNALYIAIKKSKPENARKLIALGADPDIADDDGKSLRILAEENGINFINHTI